MDKEGADAKSPAHALMWSAEGHTYVLHTPEHPPQSIIPGNEEGWCAWLTAHASFSFQGQPGHLKVLKEPRARGSGYWYAYHTSSGSTRKRYLGGSETVTLARLEAAAQDLQEVKQASSLQPSPLPASLVSLQTMPGGKETPSSTVQPGAASSMIPAS